mmetsp:Transcript_22993/g.52722  ORF Transcript_22993/g.52722 Transcript_22993/m.52722 type:complete len:205 (+) Transcript_22993:409-1023(+)|eukprot:1514727-Amphidinium_carterae.1
MRVLHTAVAEELFFKTKWSFTVKSNSKFEDCLGCCLRHLEEFANATADAPLNRAEPECPYDSLGVELLRETFQPWAFTGLFTGVREAFSWGGWCGLAMVAGMNTSSNLWRAWSMRDDLHAYRHGLMDGTTLSKNVLGMAVDAGAYVIAAPVVLLVAWREILLEPYPRLQSVAGGSSVPASALSAGLGPLERAHRNVTRGACAET